MLRDDGVKRGLIKPTKEEVEKFNLKKKIVRKPKKTEVTKETEKETIETKDDNFFI